MMITRSRLTWNCVQDYFGKAIAPVKRVILNYGPTGRSRGSATVLFSKPTAAAEAVRLDGTMVDGRKMRVCVDTPRSNS
jgi:THO complex subunit 4